MKRRHLFLHSKSFTTYRVTLYYSYCDLTQLLLCASLITKKSHTIHFVFILIHNHRKFQIKQPPRTARAGSVFKSKPKPRFFEETELELKPTFWPPSASVFLATGCWQARVHLSMTKSIIYVRNRFYVRLYSILSIKGSYFYQK